MRQKRWRRADQPSRPRRLHRARETGSDSCVPLKRDTERVREMRQDERRVRVEGGPSTARMEVVARTRRDLTRKDQEGGRQREEDAAPHEPERARALPRGRPRGGSGSGTAIPVTTIEFMREPAIGPPEKEVRGSAGGENGWPNQSPGAMGSPVALPGGRPAPCRGAARGRENAHDGERQVHARMRCGEALTPRPRRPPPRPRRAAHGVSSGMIPTEQEEAGTRRADAYPISKW
jgi:hypothetical protein